jgi:hypothetical protein
MESINIKDFVEKFDSGTFGQSSKLLGLVKKSDIDSEIRFAFKHDLSNWIVLPTSLIESVSVIKNVSGGDERMLLAKVHLKEPSNVEAKILFNLLSSLSAKVNKYYKKKWLKEMLFDESYDKKEMFHHQCMHKVMEGKCGHQHSCSDWKKHES